MPADLADREWRLIPEEARPGPMQMALEEVAAETAVAGGPRTVRAFRWAPSTLSLGYRQASESVDWAYCEEQGVGVTRRQTGGGGIYHDRHADVSYSIVAPAAELPGDLLDCYALCCEPVLDALERMGVDAAFADAERPAIHEPCCYLRAIDPAHDVVAGGDGAADGDMADDEVDGDTADDEVDGDTEDDDVHGADAGSGQASASGLDGSETAAPRKISGNAQYRQRDAVIQHGSLSYALRPERHLATFADADATPATFRERVTSIREEADVDRVTAVRHLEDALADWADARIGGWTDGELARARDLAERKYASEAWTRDREAPSDGA